MTSKIEILLGDLFRYVLHKNDIYSDGNLTLNESPPVSEGSDFTEEIGKAVLVFSYVYRVMFKNRFYKSAFDILRSRSAFDKYVEVFCARRTENSDFFTEFLVSLAFVTELAAYCFVAGSSNFCSLPAEAFLKVYPKSIENEFISKGGFKKLQESATRMSRPYEILELVIQTESPINEIFPIIKAAEYLGLGQGFFSDLKVIPQDSVQETKKEETECKEVKAGEAKNAAYSEEVLTENDAILDKIMESIKKKRDTRNFSTLIPGTSRIENWPEFSGAETSGVITEDEESQQESDADLTSGDVETAEECQDEPLNLSVKAVVQGAVARKSTRSRSLRGKTHKRQKRRNRNSKK